jgi:cytochrome P450
MKFDPGSFSFSNPELFENPYPVYEEIRRIDPIHHSQMYGGSWILFSYEDSAALLNDVRLTNNRANLPLLALPPEQRVEFAGFHDFLRTWTAFFEGEDHLLRRHRMDQVFRVLTPSRITGVVQEVVGALTSGWRRGTRVDLVAEFARRLPAVILTELMGAPRSDHEMLDHWADDLAYLFGASALTVEDVRRGWASAQAFMAYLTDLARTMTRRPDQSILGGLMARADSGFSFTEAEACAQCVLLMFAGLEPSRHIIGNAILALEQFPDQRRLLAENPRLWPSAVEEFLRYDPPVQYIGRLAAKSFTYRGHHFAKGQAVLPFVGSANRDPKHFPDPDTLDVRRRAPHLSMGSAVHHCIGASLVRVQTGVALRNLLTDFPDLHVCADVAPIWNSYAGFRGLKSLTVSL